MTVELSAERRGGGAEEDTDEEEEEEGGGELSDFVTFLVRREGEGVPSHYAPLDLPEPYLWHPPFRSPAAFPSL